MAEAQKKALIAQLALQRAEMNQSRENLESEFRLSRQVKRSMRNHPKHWALAGTLSACLLTLSLRRKKVIYSQGKKSHGLLRHSLRLATTFAKPALTTYALKIAKNYAEKRLGPLPHNSMLGDLSQK